MEFFFNQLKHVGGGMSGGRYRFPRIKGFSLSRGQVQNFFSRGTTSRSGKSLYDTVKRAGTEGNRIIIKKTGKTLGKLGVPKEVDGIPVRGPLTGLILGIGYEAAQWGLQKGATKVGEKIGPVAQEQGDNLLKYLSSIGASNYSGLPWYLKKKRLAQIERQAYKAYRYYRRSRNYG